MEAEQLDINEALGLGGETAPEPVEQPKEEAQEQEQEQESEFSETESKAMEQGWNKDKYKDDPDNYRNAKDFVEFGEMRSYMDTMKNQIRGMKKSHNEDISNLNLLHKASMDKREVELKSELTKAVEDGDHEKVASITDEQVSIAQQKNVVTAQPAVDEGSLMEGWYNKNEWFFDKSDPRAGFADNSYNIATRKGLSGEERLEFVDSAVTEKFPVKAKSNVNQNRNQPSDYSGSNGAPKSREKKLTMADVTPAEMEMRVVFATDETFLKSLQNSRKGV